MAPRSVRTRTDWSTDAEERFVCVDIYPPRRKEQSDGLRQDGVVIPERENHVSSVAAAAVRVHPAAACVRHRRHLVRVARSLFVGRAAVAPVRMWFGAL